MNNYQYENKNRSRKMKKSKITFFNVMKLLSILVCVVIAVLAIKSIASPKTGNVKVDQKINIKNPDSYYEDLVSKYVDSAEDENLNHVIESYKNLGIIKCDGYINFRNAPDVLDTRSIIGLMTNGTACDILQWDIKGSETYCKVESGGMTGYIAKQYVITGDAAKAAAKKNIKLHAIMLADRLRMREKPSIDSEQIGTTNKGERYEFVERMGDWIKIVADNVDGATYAYVSSNNNNYVEVMLSLNEARAQNLKNDVLNHYDNIGVSTAKDYLNIRKSAKSNAAVIGKLPGKGGCEVLGTSGDFYKIRSGKITGYVSKQFLATGKRAEDLATQYADLRAIVKIAALKVRTGPGTKYKQWTTITKEETYIVTNQLDGWVEIELDGGDNKKSDKGYVSTQNSYVEVRYALDQAIEYKAVSSSISSNRKKLVETAMKYLGNPYVWGGNSLTSGVDCSGFVQQLFKMYGVTLPRVAREQAKKGTAIKSNNMKPGDLIFYANSDGVVDHVAIYIGNNQIIHAASTKSGIKISKYNYRTPVAIRNILGK